MDPAAAITEVNRRIHEGDSAQFITLAVIVLDLKFHVASIVCAGHGSRILRGSSGNIERLAGQDNLPLGGLESAEYRANSIALAPGESLTLTNDGVDQAMNAAGELYSVPRVVRQIADSDGTPRGIGETLRDDWREFTGHRAQNDDMCVVCVGRSV